jgi:hypothetical protein
MTLTTLTASSLDEIAQAAIESGYAISTKHGCETNNVKTSYFSGRSLAHHSPYPTKEAQRQGSLVNYYVGEHNAKESDALADFVDPLATVVEWHTWGGSNTCYVYAAELDIVRNLATLKKQIALMPKSPVLLEDIPAKTPRLFELHITMDNPNDKKLQYMTALQSAITSRLAQKNA